MGALDIINRKPTPAELEVRFLELLADERYSELGPWELNEFGEIVVSPVSGSHGLSQVEFASEIKRQIGGKAWVEQGIRRDDGPPIVPDILWSSREFFEAHQASGLLPHAPRLCIEVMSASNAIERMREKCQIYLILGAEEAWIVDPMSRVIEIYGPSGRITASALGIDLDQLWRALDS